MIFAGYSGMGKSALGEERTDVLDFALVPYKYEFPKDYDKDSFTEADKGNVIYDFKRTYPIYYCMDLLKKRRKYRHIIIPSDSRVLDILDACGVGYILCLPNFFDKDMKEVYRKRYIARGNVDRFLNIFINGWDSYMNSLGKRKCRILLLEKDQFMSDAVLAYEEGRFVHKRSVEWGKFFMHIFPADASEEERERYEGELVAWKAFADFDILHKETTHCPKCGRKVRVVPFGDEYMVNCLCGYVNINKFLFADNLDEEL